MSGTIPPSPPPTGQPATQPGGPAILRGSLWLWLQEAGEMALAFAFTWLVVRRLGADGFGLVVLVQSVVNIAGLATLNLELALMRFLPDYRSQQWGQAVRQTTWIIVIAKTVLAAIASLLLFFLAAPIAAYYQQDHLAPALEIGALSLFSTTIVTTGKAFCLGWLRPSIRAILSFVRRLVELAGLLLVINLGVVDVTRVVAVLSAADTVAAVAFLAVIIYYLRREPAGTGAAIPTPVLARRILNYCLPLIGVQLTEIAGQNMGKLLLGRLAPPAVLGLYSVARLAIDRLMLLMSQLPLMALPVLAERGEESGQEGRNNYLIGRLLQYQWAIGLLVNVAVWAAAPILLLILGEGDVRPVEPALRILGFSVLLWAGAGVTHIFFFLYERTTGILILNAGQLALTGLLYLLFVPRWQATGAALADVIAQGLELALGLWLAYRWFGFPSGRAVPPLVKQTALAVLLVLPIWLVPQMGYGWLALWAVAAVVLLLSYLLRLNVPDAAEWLLVESTDTRYPQLNRLKQLLSHSIQRYQARLQMKVPHE